MKQFIKKMALYSIPLLLLAIVAELLLRRIPNAYHLKAATYTKDAGKFRVWILGSSYGLYNLNPVWFDQKTFNGSHVLQSLDIDTKIFSKYEKNFDQLEYVIIPITYASFFYKLENSPAKFLLKNYSIYYGLNLGIKPSQYLEILDQSFSVNRTRLYSYYSNHHSELKMTPLGFDSTYHSAGRKTTIGGPTAREAIDRLDVTGTDLFEEQKSNLEKIIRRCDERNIKLLLFTPPAYKGFYAPGDTANLNIVISACQNMQSKYSNVRYFNFLSDTSFTIDDFYDYSHLNEIGAKKLSAKFNSIIKDDAVK
jgi:hypothetical protein